MQLRTTWSYRHEDTMKAAEHMMMQRHQFERTQRDKRKRMQAKPKRKKEGSRGRAAVPTPLPQPAWSRGGDRPGEDRSSIRSMDK